MNVAWCKKREEKIKICFALYLFLYVINAWIVNCCDIDGNGGQLS